MRVHHLNCGSMRAIETTGLAPLPAVCHCLLVETDTDGLVLVDTGFGLPDLDRPARTLGEQFLEWAEPVLDPAETALRQLPLLGYDPADVRHVVLTHMHRDHTGGLPDFPHATVHVHTDEYRAATTHPTAGRYPQAHWAHGPRWSRYDGTGGDRWYGFDRVRQPAGLPPEILLIPLGGHTPGHTGVALDTGAGWLLHAGDTYYHHNELQSGPAPAPPVLRALQDRMETGRAHRLSNLDRLRRLAHDPAANVRVLSAHDPWEFRRNHRA